MTFPTTAAPPPTRQRRRVPVWVVLGRVWLVAVAAIVVTLAVLRPVDLVGDPSKPFPMNLPELEYIGLAMLFAALGPFTLLPVGSVRAAHVDGDGVLSVPTVLGTRRVDLGELSGVGAVRHRGGVRASDHYYLVLRQPVLRWVVVLLGVAPRVPPEIWDRVERTAALRPQIVSARARATFGLGRRPGAGQRFLMGGLTALVGLVGFLVWVALVVTVFVLLVTFPV